MQIFGILAACYEAIKEQIEAINEQIEAINEHRTYKKIQEIDENWRTPLNVSESLPPL